MVHRPHKYANTEIGLQVESPCRFSGSVFCVLITQCWLHTDARVARVPSSELAAALRTTGSFVRSLYVRLEQVVCTHTRIDKRRHHRRSCTHARDNAMFLQLRASVSSGVIEEDTLETLIGMLAERFPSVVGESKENGRNNVPENGKQKMPKKWFWSVRVSTRRKMCTYLVT